MLKKILVITAIIAFLMLGFVYRIVFSPNVKSVADRFVVKPETSIDTLAEHLKPFLKHPLYFNITARLKRFRRPKPGLYTIQPGMSSNDLVNMFRAGREKEVELTFNNMASLEQLAGRAAHYLYADSLSFLRAMQDSDFLRKNGFNRENALLMYIPNTYRFYYFTTPEQFRSRMLREYIKFWQGKRTKEAEKIGLTPIQTGILASIVQKETNVAAEKPVIAGVYLNRLRRGMKLQADPTVVYAYRRVTGDTTTIRRVLDKHLAVESPYNTYKVNGLPPGPIIMPDISSIDAVLHAKHHQYLYFSADPARPGHHLFARTLNEHLRNAGKYHAQLNKRRILH